MENVRSHIFQHCGNHYKALQVTRPSMENLHFKSLTAEEGGDLVKPFSLEEVRQAV